GLTCGQPYATAKKMEETLVYSKFESIAQAQKICETHGVPKTARNLTAVLDIPKVSLAKHLESPPPAKRPRCESPLFTDEEDDTVSLGSEVEPDFAEDVDMHDITDGLDTSFVNEARCVAVTKSLNHKFTDLYR